MSMLLADLHELGVALFIFLSVVSLVLIVSKPVAKEFEATTVEWIRTFKRIKEEWHKPLVVESTVQQVQVLDQSSSKHESGSICQSNVE